MAKTIFISSTFKDLARYRGEIWKLLGNYNVSVMGMEAFGARKEAPLQTCIHEVEQSDVYIGVIGFRLGSVDPETGKSYTQLEYDRAVELDKEIRIYLMDDANALVTANMVDTGPEAEKLEIFKGVLKTRHTVAFFGSEEDLVSKLKNDLGRLLEARERTSDDTDDFNVASNTLKRFSLAPKLVAGQQVHLRVVRKGEPFPASHGICSVFNLEYGNTVGLPIEIQVPNGFSDIGLSKMYASGRRVPDFLSVTQENEFDTFATLLFTPDDVPETRANFKAETRVSLNQALMWSSRANARPAEGTIALLFAGFAREEE